MPLGGTKKQAMTIWLIFTFIGLWHDLKTRWLAWALLNCAFFSVEILVLIYFHSIKVYNQKDPLTPASVAVVMEETIL